MANQYTLLARLGTGGFGTVYRARIEGTHGARRDVALKVLDDAVANDEVLGRFRDEARMLARIRHPNVPSVSPPLHLDGGWAVAMDLVPGVDCGRVLKKGGPLPHRVALEVVALVAQTLTDLHHWKDYDDEDTLALLHRDIKPSNIMITKSGAIKVLDFGSAFARFEERESITTSNIGGTVGYIPPERVDGVEGPAGDVFSLGVVLHSFLTGEKPASLTQGGGEFVPPDDAPEPMIRMLEMAHSMRSLDPDHRPTAAEVALWARELAASTTGTTLRDWAAFNIPEYAPRSDDERIGEILRMPAADVEDMVFAASGAPVDRSVAGGLAVAMLIVGLVLGLWVGRATAPGPVALVSVAPGDLSPVPVAPVRPDAPVPTAPVPTPPVPAAPVPTEASPPVASIQTDPVRPDPLDSMRPQPVPSPPVPPQTGPVPTPAPDPQPVRPRPTPVPRPRPEPSTPEGSVTLTGDLGAGTYLVRSGQRVGLTGLGPGSYDIYVKWGGEAVHAGSVTLASEEAVTLRCRERFRRCVP